MLNLSHIFPQEDIDLKVTLALDGATYDVRYFSVSFDQEVDHKGQPQQETLGGQIRLSFLQMLPDNIAKWAKADDLRKDGDILFSTATSGSVLTVHFEDAYCVGYSRTVNIHTGSETFLTIAPGCVSLNDVHHDKGWRY